MSIYIDDGACSKLLRGLGLTPAEIRDRMIAARPECAAPSALVIMAWLRQKFHQRPPDEVRVWLAQSLGLDIDVLLRACVGIPAFDNDFYVRLDALPKGASTRPLLAEARERYGDTHPEVLRFAAMADFLDP